MNKARLFILVMLAVLILVGAGCLSKNIAIIIVGVVAECILGSLVSIIIEKIDTQGHGLKLWYQSLKYRNKEIRLSISYLFRIEVDGKYLLVKGNRINSQFQPVGGVYKYYDEAKSFLNDINYRSDTDMGNNNETDDLRIRIKGKYLLNFMTWFLSMKDREYDPRREFYEELIATELLSEKMFSNFKYKKIFVHNQGITYSEYLDCDELLYSDIFEINLSDVQKREIRNAVINNPDELCLASADEIKCMRINSVARNIGNNAIWLLGE